MRWLRYIIPDDLKNSLNANPGFQWLIIVIMVVVGVLLMINGISGIRAKRIKGKNGRVFEGTTAQIIGAIYVVLGLALPLVAVATQL